jgi:hypothetical protein
MLPWKLKPEAPTPNIEPQNLFPSAREAARHYLKKLDQHRRSQQAETSSAKTPAPSKP